jgi:hypothetical protein
MTVFFLGLLIAEHKMTKEEYTKAVLKDAVAAEALLRASVRAVPDRPPEASPLGTEVRPLYATEP